MTDPAAASVRALAFGSPDGSLWGAACDHGAAALVLGCDGVSTGVADGLRWESEDGGRWRLEGDGVQLTVSPAAAVAGEDPEGPAVAPDDPELCRVQGTIIVGAGGAGSERRVDCAGTRAVAAASGSRRSAPGAARFVGAWFVDGAALGVLALRPRKARHQDADAVTATVFDPNRWIPVGDPRLSTTYDGSGAPTRTNLELWITDGENEFPRRAAGEAAGPGATASAGEGAASADGLALQVVPLRCHSRGEEGAGVYALATFPGSRS
jgi:hypothetical protein